MPSFLTLLRQAVGPVVSVELRPPRAELVGTAGIDAWIDTYHAVRSLARRGVRVMVTDSAVGAQEENNLRHLVANVGAELARTHVVPFLTAKHSLAFCLEYVDQAVDRGFRSLVVLGGDRHLGRPRCVEHAWQLRELIAARHPGLELGGWANPTADPARQVGYLCDARVSASFYLTQIVSHHRAADVERFLAEADRRGLAMPGVFGVFYYRSANPRTLDALARFLPVPAAALAAEFAAGADPVDICARTLRTMAGLGVRHFYVSNLPLRGTAATLDAVLERAGLAAGAASGRSAAR